MKVYYIKNSSNEELHIKELFEPMPTLEDVFNKMRGKNVWIRLKFSSCEKSQVNIILYTALNEYVLPIYYLEHANIDNNPFYSVVPNPEGKGGYSMLSYAIPTDPILRVEVVASPNCPIDFIGVSQECDLFESTPATVLFKPLSTQTQNQKEGSRFKKITKWGLVFLVVYGVSRLLSSEKTKEKKKEKAKEVNL